MSKFLYTYSVVRIDGGRKSVVLDKYADKAGAEKLLVAALNNVPGRQFKMREHRTANPDYVVV